jgi:hypothetical protein
MVTCPPAGTAAGAEYVVLEPLDVEAGLNDPQLPAGMQLQVTPAFAESFVTVAATLAVPPTAIDEGGMVDMVTAIEGGGGGACWDPPPHPADMRPVENKTHRGSFLIMDDAPRRLD